MKRSGNLATVTEIQDFHKSKTRLLTLVCQRPLEFHGGMWIMANLGITLENGKSAKRAYSIITPDTQKQTFQISVKALNSGHTSDAMHELNRGDRFSFSGPYGKNFHVPVDHDFDQLISQHPRISRVWIIATDTGITASLGIWQSQALQKMQRQFSSFHVELLWFAAKDYFLPIDFVKKIVSDLQWVEMPAPAIDRISKTHSERMAVVKQKFENLIANYGCADLIFLSGDGWIIETEIKEYLLLNLTTKQQPIKIFTDTFFHQKNKLSN